MRQVLAGFVASLVLSASPAVQAEARSAMPPVRPLRVVTLNLDHGGPFSGLVGDGQHLERRLQLTVKELQELDPDIIGLQEASEGRGRGNVAARLAAQLGLQSVYAVANPQPVRNGWINRLLAFLLNFSEGPAIVSRFPIKTWEALDLPRCGRWADSRLLLHATLESPWGGLDVFSAHTLGDPCQTEQVARLVRNRRGAIPALLMGDFNATEDSPAVAAFTRNGGFVDAFRSANPSVPGLTVWQPVDAPTSRVRRRGDYVFVFPGEEYGGKVLSSRVVLNTPQPMPDGGTLWPSDHYGVLAEVEVFPPNHRP